MKTNTQILLLGVLTASLSILGVAKAQTIIAGPNISGTWSSSGNPYYVTANCTIPSGQTLTIQPGVVVDIGAGLSITANGTIQAVGTPSQRITFNSFISSQFWNTITVNGAAAMNQFNYCDFQNAATALAFNSEPTSVNEVLFSTFMNVTNGIQMAAFPYNSAAGTQTTTILNCVFSNCYSQAVYSSAQGVAVASGFGGYYYDAVINIVMKNCTFNGAGSGCAFNIYGATASSFFFGTHTGYGYASLQIMNNIFNNIANTAIAMTVGSDAGSSQPTLINNTVVNCGTGVSAADPWDATLEDCVFVGCTNAVQDTGSLSRNVSFNDFYGNATNFTGYNVNYGTWIIPNRNGTLSDVSGNIGSNPLFVATSDFHLASGSPCVNAGTPNSAYANICSPPSVSTKYPDLGAYGGPDACNWLDPVPILPAQLSMSKSNGCVWLNWAAIPRSTYRIEYDATNNLGAMAGTNLWRTNTTLIPSAKPVSIAVSPNPPTNKAAFYRVRSLGRTPGN